MTNLGQCRVFVTGIGLVSPHGCDDPNQIFDKLYCGKSAIDLVCTETLGIKRSSLVAPANFDPVGKIPKTQLLLMDRVSQMALLAANQALENAQLLSGNAKLASTGIYLGCGLGGSQTIENVYHTLFVKKSCAVRPASVPLIMPNASAGHISMYHKLGGPSQTYSVACASSSIAIGEAFRAIRDGYLGRVIAGGTEAMLNFGSMACWDALTVLAKEHPEGAYASCRPFSKDRNGLVLGEGAAMLILESEALVTARNIQPLAEIIGYGASSDSHNLTQPAAEGQVRAMRLALVDAKLDPTAIGYINAHATGTQAGDKIEIQAIKLVFAEHAKRIAVSSTKSMHGHLLGAAGALEFAITVMALQKGKIPPTAHLSQPDPDCALDCIPHVGRLFPTLKYALSNSFAFGGSNAVLIAQRV